MGRLIAAAAVLFAVLAAPAPAASFTVTSFDGTRIHANFFPAAGLPADARAPTVFFGPGYSSGGETNPDAASSDVFGTVGVGPLRRAGYNVVTWDPRGFGKSGGTVQLDSPEHDARDVQALIDAVAGFRQVLLDAPGDPRMGMTGVSYGGGIQLSTAQREPRIDAIAPTIAWHSLISSLFKEGDLKAGWGAVLCGAGESRGLAEGIFSATGPELGGQDPVITRTCTRGTVEGRSPTPADLAWFAARGPGHLVDRIRVPTLLVQGTVDTLFTLREAMDNHAVLERAGVPLKMMWFCGGHGGCLTGAGTPLHVERRVIAWLDRHVRGRAVDTGPAFEWLADDAVWRGAAGFPLPVRGHLRGRGSGTLGLEPAAASGAGLGASPAPPGTSLEVPFDPPSEPADVLGEPRLRLTYSGEATPQKTWVYAQILDVRRNLVAGNLMTPIPLRLDGGTHTIDRPLEPVALRAPAGARYRLQLVPSSTVYYPQRAVGTVRVLSAEATLPVADASRAAASIAERRGTRDRRACPSSRNRGFRRVVIRGGSSLRLRVSRRVPRAFRVVVVRRSDGRRVASARRRAGSFRFGRGLRDGRYLVRVIMPLARGRRDVRQARARVEDGRWRVARVRYAGSC